MSSESVTSKITRIKSLDDREKAIFERIMADKNFKVLDVAKEMFMGESTFRNIMGGMFEKLGVPKDVLAGEKRGWVVREYAEAFTKMDLPPEEWEPKPPPEPSQRVSVRPERSQETPPEPKEPEMKPRAAQTPPPSTPRSEPTINVRPQAPRTVNRTAATGGELGGFIVVGICAVVVLVIIIGVLNNLPGQQNNGGSQSAWGTHDWWDSVTLTDNVTIRGGSYFSTFCSDQESFDMQLVIENNRGSDFSWDVNQSNFSLVDSNGKSYSLISVYFIAGGYHQDIHSGQGAIILTCWAGRSLDETGVSYLDLTMKNYPGLYDITFRRGH